MLGTHISSVIGFLLTDFIMQHSLVCEQYYNLYGCGQVSPLSLIRCMNATLSDRQSNL